MMISQRYGCGAMCVLMALAPALFAQGEELVIAFSLDTPPYVMNGAKNGIEIDIVRAALKLKGHTFTTKQMPYGELANAVRRDGVDAAATVMKADDGTYYSENYITFKNAAITKMSAKLKINSIADLKGKSIVAWENAYEDLGEEFQTLFSPEVKDSYRDKYREIGDQKKQAEMFWKGEAEVIVIDVTVMKWFTRELADQIDISAELEYHNIFPATTQFCISFKSEQVRDDFNAGLEQIRKQRLYRKIYAEYLK